MASDSRAEPPAKPARPYIQYSANLGRAICVRLAAGETLVAICADPDMPARSTVGRWAREIPRFAKTFHRAKTFARRDGLGPTTTYCEVVAHEICVRISEGESLTAICDDPAMPAMWTVLHWQRQSADFAQALALAREAAAERLADLGWTLALEATPQTAHLTRVRLGHLRWSAAIKAPRTHGKLKATEPPAPPDPPTTFLFRHFHIERDDERRLHRVVGYTPDPKTMQPVRDSEGEWTPQPDPVAKARAVEELYAKRLANRSPSQPPAPKPARDDLDDYWG